MPRTATESLRTTERWGPRRPRPSRVSRCVSERPMPLLTWVTLSLIAMVVCLARGRLAALMEVRHVLATRLRHLFDRAERLERHDRCVDDVVLVRRADRLGEDVVDTRDLEHWTNAATRDHAGTGGRRLQEHLGGAEE